MAGSTEPKPKKKAKKAKKAGRPPRYKPEYNQQATKFCLLGATNDQLAEMFGVTTTTIDNWIKKHPGFIGAIKEGREVADANVANSLYHRALGYSHSDTDIRVIDEEIVMTEITKHYPPDTGAAMAWLKNRRRQNWRDIKAVEMSSDPNNPLVIQPVQYAEKK